MFLINEKEKMETITIHMDKIQGWLKFENSTFNKFMEKK
jgi:hypothetical protein